ncbi:hypothetical protein C8J57DRAFT_1609089 [Mycena rebaudengoi]|nr:hypothetical protein C8J57DRAFT_1609089 [Mycena rebaudengoi]
MDPTLLGVLRNNGVPTDEQALQIRRVLHSVRLQTNRNCPYESAVSAHKRRQLSAILRGTLSAIRRFPPEILSHIFIFCRDTSLSLPYYMITNVNFAPMLLTHVCSRWRMIARDTPRLWSHVQLLTPAFFGGRHTFIDEILHISRNLPLSVIVETPPPIYSMDGSWLCLDGANDYHDRWLDVVWNTHPRLSSFTLDITSDDHTPHIFPRHTVFPALSSLTLSICGNDEPDLVAILESFRHAPSLLSLELAVDNCSDAILQATFPWRQLTTLKMSLPLTSDVARAILVQCTSLEIAKFHTLFEFDAEFDLPPSENSTLHNLHQLDIQWSLGTGADMLLEELSLPVLTSLSISSPEPPTSVLFALHERSHFALEHLSLEHQRLSPSELLSLLRVMPALRTLNIHQCTCIVNDLFDFLGRAASSSLQLPQLTTLEIHPLTDTLDGNIVATMAESLAKHVGKPATAFPLLRRVCLYRGHPHFVNYPRATFADDVERRLAAVCATGFLVDRYQRSWDPPLPAITV